MAEHDNSTPGLLRRVTAELRLLRRLPGRFTDAKLTLTPYILKGLGGGDTEAAMNRLLLLRARHRDDHEIAAAIASIGFEVDGGNVLDRLSAYGEANFVDARTVRRWSDAGIGKLASILVSEAPWIDPRIGLQVSVEDSELVCEIEFVVPDQIGMKRPQFAANGRIYDLVYKRLNTATGIYAARYRCQAIRITLDSETRIELALRWVGEITASYVFETKNLGEWQSHCRLRLREMIAVVYRPTEDTGVAQHRVLCPDQ